MSTYTLSLCLALLCITQQCVTASPRTTITFHDSPHSAVGNVNPHNNNNNLSPDNNNNNNNNNNKAEYVIGLEPIESLPDWRPEPGTPSDLPKLFSGYLSGGPGHSLFTVFAPADNPGAAQRTGVWFQGGPGCDSLIGFFTENGPVRFSTDGALTHNTLSWTKMMNMVYITSPPCVGFSQSADGCSSTDNSTAVDNLAAVEDLLKHVPALAETDLFLLGESYAGNYVPHTALDILQKGSVAVRNAFKGIAIGNPVMSCGSWKVGSNDTQVELFYWHAMIPLRVRDQWFSECSGGERGSSPQCVQLMTTINDLTGTIDPDDLYSNTCTGNASLANAASPPASQCKTVQQYRTDYLNREDVQTAMHAMKPMNPAGWTACASAPALNYTTVWPDMLPFYRYFFENAPHLKILIYSGDADIATVPHAYTQQCLRDLAVTISEPWRTWRTPNGQRAGYVEKYTENGLVFATVIGAGHETPMYSPLSAHILLERFLNNERI